MQTGESCQSNSRSKSTVFLAFFWILRLRFAPRRMTFLRPYESCSIVVSDLVLMSENCQSQGLICGSVALFEFFEREAVFLGDEVDVFVAATAEIDEY